MHFTSQLCCCIRFPVRCLLWGLCKSWYMFKRQHLCIPADSITAMVFAVWSIMLAQFLVMTKLPRVRLHAAYPLLSVLQVILWKLFLKKLTQAHEILRTVSGFSISFPTFKSILFQAVWCEECRHSACHRRYQNLISFYMFLVNVGNWLNHPMADQLILMTEQISYDLLQNSSSMEVIIFWVEEGRLTMAMSVAGNLSERAPCNCSCPLPRTT